ncbi:MAG: GNAT family N-acetyltransferase [Flammeovirgaceae bacterium]|nr:GNAT family N-acetyltransferase [Flammeovirgaceae bacterium]MBE62823.1 GNAT family N-acetyltransferase [Flammeovirgaceae bacterium]MBR08681.1 GNAT family N-acetyltransferase [Rickettsiales bacterium]HCX25120.1 GNAT family N-acetyltransferase [Cytophagales bacterium]
MNLKRTNHTNEDFQTLIKQLDEDLRGRYPEDQDEYDQYNKVDSIDHVLVAYVDDQPAGCGCFKTYGKDAVEIKRMFVKHSFRGKGISKAVLRELENWAQELGFAKTVLETGTAQTEAIGLYTKLNYRRIPNYGQYAHMPMSICFEKRLK